MYLFHPPLSALPLGVFVFLLLLETVTLCKRNKVSSQISVYLLVFFALAVGLAFLSGYQASEYAQQTFNVDSDVIVRHHTFGKLLLFSLVPCLAFKLVKDRALHAKTFFTLSYWLFLMVSCGLLLTTGYLGGELVFRYGAGVYATH